MSQAQSPIAQCRNCRHFRNDPAYLESAFPGLTSLSSGYGSVRADDGVCLLHDRYLRATYSCGSFAAVGAAESDQAA